MESNCRLTTFDNPFDPFEQFASWLLFDNEKGYNTCEYLARMTNFGDDFTEKEMNEEEERAIDDIIAHDFRCIYKKVKRNSKSKESTEEVEH